MRTPLSYTRFLAYVFDKLHLLLVVLLVRASEPCFLLAGGICKFYFGVFNHCSILRCLGSVRHQLQANQLPRDLSSVHLPMFHLYPFLVHFYIYDSPLLQYCLYLFPSLFLPKKPYFAPSSCLFFVSLFSVLFISNAMF
jgi:hypothetical protein